MNKQCSSKNNTGLLQKGDTFRIPCFIGTQNSQNVNIYNKVQKTKTIKTQVIAGYITPNINYYPSNG